MCTKITYKFYVTFYTFLFLTLMLQFDTINCDEVIIMPLCYDKLFDLLKQKGISLSTLRRLKVEPINGRTVQIIKNNGSLTLTTISRICDALECNICDIVDYIPDDKNSERRGLIFSPDAKTIPLRLFEDSASAGYGNNSVNSNNYTIINVAKTDLNAKADYAVKVGGYSMFPQFNNGDIVLVKQQPDVPIGEVGIFTVNGETYIKQRGDGELISVNPNFPNIPFGENDTIVCNGIVLGKIDKIKKPRNS